MSAPHPSPTVSVVIPACNEEHNLPLVLDALPAVDQVVVVDGGSADDTVAAARRARPDAVVVRQTRSGKGNALACGFAASTGDIVVTVNADGSTDPGEIPRYVDALLSGAEVAHGSRYRDGGADLGGTAVDRAGNRVLSGLVNALFGSRFTDVDFGYNAVWRRLVPNLDLPAPDPGGDALGRPAWGDGSEIEPLLAIRAAAQGLRVVEIASISYPAIHGTRRRRRIRRALRTLRTAGTEYARRWRLGRPAGEQPRAGRHAHPAATMTGGRHAARQRSAGTPATPGASVLVPQPRLRGGGDRRRGYPGRSGPVADDNVRRRGAGGSRRRPDGADLTVVPDVALEADDAAPRTGGHLRAVPDERPG